MSGQPDDLPNDTAPSDGVESVSGVGPTYGSQLRDAGYTSVTDLQEASTEELATAVPVNVASEIKSAVGNARRNIPDMDKAKQVAQEQPGAVAKMVRVDGRQVAKVLELTQEQQLDGATVEVHKG